MAIDIRPLQESDYDEILLGWWKDWEWQAPPKDALPREGTGGLMVFDNEEPVCAGFMYLSNSSVCWVDWIISNKEYRKPERAECITLLIDSLTYMAKQSGGKYSYALIKHEKLSKSYEDLGYVKGDSYTSEMIKTL